MLSGIGSVLTGSNPLGTTAANLGYGGGGIDGLLTTNGAYGTAAPAAAGSLGSSVASLGAAGIAVGMIAGVYGMLTADTNYEWKDIGWGSVKQGGIDYSYVEEKNKFGGIDYRVTDPSGFLFHANNLTNLASSEAYAQQQIANQNTSGGAFADGGDFGGGLRLVGERGPELEVTGPSRIFDAQTTASMLRSGGASGAELADELRLLREEVRGLRADVQRGNANTQLTADRLSGRQGVPFLVQVAPA